MKRILKKTIFRKKEKTFLESLHLLLSLGRIFGNVLITFDDDSILKPIMIALPLQIIYLIYCINYLDLINLFKTSTKFERISDYIFLIILASGILLKPIYYFLKREQHKRILHDINNLNRYLYVKEKRADFVIDFRVIFIITLLILTDVMIVTVFKNLQMVNDTKGSYFIILSSLNSNRLGEYINQCVIGEITKQFKMLNEKIVDCQQDMSEAVKAVEARAKLLRISEKFNDICTFPQLIVLSLFVTMGVWELHSGFLFIINKLSHYRYRILFLFIRMFIVLTSVAVIIRTWCSITKEVNVV
ncbi:hypothetical protein QE152_g32334 [Popillia japonica]|uniref:Gustatory receptor n=1 Tax=Popillia japonica TaxID=7064 RepID=A0AAW1IZ64_POPJA